ncbi:hypothetical protein D3C80_745180 [compost metagenome]
MDLNELMRNISKINGGAGWHYANKYHECASNLMTVSIEDSTKEQDGRFLVNNGRGLIHVIYNSGSLFIPKDLRATDVLDQIHQCYSRAQFDHPHYQECLAAVVKKVRPHIRRFVEEVQTFDRHRPMTIIQLHGTSIEALRIGVTAEGAGLLIHPQGSTEPFPVDSVDRWFKNATDRPLKKPIKCFVEEGRRIMPPNGFTAAYLQQQGLTNVIEVKVQYTHNAPDSGRHEQYFRERYMPMTEIFVEAN